jgi:DNA-binding transcriptional ArsR family regulator
MKGRRIERTGDDAVFRALADRTRRTLLDELRKGPRTTGQLCEAVHDLSRFAVMDHLDVLVDAELVIVVRKGRERFNYLNPVPIQRIHQRWMAPIAEATAVELLALEAATHPKEHADDN